MSDLIPRLEKAHAPAVDGAALRGLAIFGIFLHNYSHALRGIVVENEYSFVAKHPSQLLYQLQHPTAELPLHLLSFFGHYGVPLFLFLSAYGLEKKYSTNDKPAPTSRFITSHYAKLWVMMLIGFLPFLVLDIVSMGGLRIPLENLLAQLTMVNTLFPFVPHMVFPGPYWYFALMVQVYIIYRLFLFRRSWVWAVGMLFLCQTVQHLLQDHTVALMWLRYNFVGSMLPFVLGLLYARYGRSISTGAALALLLLSLLGIFFGSFFFATWLWIPALVCIAGLTALQLLPEVLRRPLAWLGGISSAIFVIHPLIRRITLRYFADEQYLGLAVYTVVTILTAWMLQPWMNRALAWVAKRFSSKQA